MSDAIRLDTLEITVWIGVTEAVVSDAIRLDLLEIRKKLVT